MGSPVIPPLPPGFSLDRPSAGGGRLPPLPPGFRLDSAPEAAPRSFFDMAMAGGQHGYGGGAPRDPDLGAGIVKGAGSTVNSLGRVTRAVGAGLGITDPATDEFDQVEEAVTPQNMGERVGAGAEQAAEFFLIPGPGKVKLAERLVTQALPTAALTAAQGGSPEAAAATAALSVIPFGAAIDKVGRKLKDVGAGLVRSHIKPTVAAMKQVAGASAQGIEVKARQFVKFILDNKLATAEQARKIIQESGDEVHRLLAVKNAPTDAATRSQRYLEALRRRASKQALPESDVNTIENAMREMLRNDMGEDVVRTVMKPSSLVDDAGKPFMRPAEETARALRADVPADEALASARSTSAHTTRKNYGEMKGMEMESAKAIERAQRDAVKAAVPEVAPVLRRQGNAIESAKMLDRAEFRMGNRDAAALPAQIAGAEEIRQGNIPVIGFAINYLRDNQARMGIWADRLGRAIERGNAPEIVFYLQKAGVAVPPQLLRPAPAAR